MNRADEVHIIEKHEIRHNASIGAEIGSPPRGLKDATVSLEPQEGGNGSRN